MKHSWKGIPVLVTGGAGFIGSHLVEALVALNAHVTVLDNLSTGTLENIQSVHNKIDFIKGDITNFKDCLNACKNQFIIFHTAALISVPDSIDDPAAYFHGNVSGTFNMLQAAHQSQISRFIFSSSAAVYGNYEGLCHEKMPCSPTSMYGTSKLMGEELCRLYAHTHRLYTLSLRYFNVYSSQATGYRQKNGFIAHIRNQLAQDMPINLYGDGLQTRDFVPIKTIVEANLAAAQNKSKELSGTALNVASGSSLSIIDMAIKISLTEFQNQNPYINYEKARLGDVQHSRADITALQTLVQDSNHITL